MVGSGEEDESVVRVTLALARRWPVLLLLGLTVAAAAGGAGAGYFLKLDLPDVRSLEDYTPPLMTRVLAADAPPQDAKTALQEWAQGRGLALPSYAVVSREGPDHAPAFTVRVEIPGGPSAEGQGPTKRVAEQIAARRALESLPK